MITIGYDDKTKIKYIHKKIYYMPQFCNILYLRHFIYA